MSDDEDLGKIPHEHSFDCLVINEGRFITKRWLRCECGYRGKTIWCLTLLSIKIMIVASAIVTYIMGFIGGWAARS